MKRSKLWSGLTSTSAALLVVGLIGQNLAAANASYINTALGTTTTKVVQTGEAGDTTYFKSQFGDFDDPDAQAAAIAAALEQNVNEMREGAALLGRTPFLSSGEPGFQRRFSIPLYNDLRCHALKWNRGGQP